MRGSKRGQQRLIAVSQCRPAGHSEPTEQISEEVNPPAQETAIRGRMCVLLGQRLTTVALGSDEHFVEFREVLGEPVTRRTDWEVILEKRVGRLVTLLLVENLLLWFSVHLTVRFFGCVR